MGLPDSEVFVGAETSIAPLLKRLGLDKARAKKFIARQTPPETSFVKGNRTQANDFINYYCDFYRRKAVLLHIMVGQDSESLKRSSIYSWDKIVLDDYYPDLLNNSASEPKQFYAKPKFNIGDSLPSLTLQTATSIGNYTEANDEKDKALRDLDSFNALTKPRVSGFTEQLFYDLACWKQQSEEEKARLARVVWASGLVVSLELLNDCLEAEPDLCSFYSKNLSKQEPGVYEEIEVQRKSTHEEKISNNNESPLGLEEQSIGELCDELKIKVNALSEDPLNKALMSEIMAFALIIQTKQEEVRYATEEDMQELITRITAFFPIFQQDNELSHHFTGEDISGFANEWLFWLVGTAKDYSVEQVIEAMSAVKFKIKDKIEAAQIKTRELDDINVELRQLKRQESGSGIRARRDNEKRITNLRLKEAAHKETLNDTLVEIFEAIHPDEYETGSFQKGGVFTAFPSERAQQLISTLQVRADNDLDSDSISPEQSADQVENTDTDDGIEIQEETVGEPRPEISCDTTPSYTGDAEPEPGRKDVAAEPKADAQDHNSEMKWSSSHTRENRADREQHVKPESDDVIQQEVVRITTKAHLDEGAACLDSLEADAFIPGSKVNSLLNQLIGVQQLNYASQLAYSLEATKLSVDFLSWKLFKAAYYGINTFDDQYVFSKVQRTLNSISPSDIEVWMDQRCAEAVPFLVLASAFQPTVFGGTECTGHLLLDALPATLFDRNTHSLITETAEMARRSEKITIAMLRQARSGREEELPKFDKSQVEEWKKKILTATRGYAPIRKAQTMSLESGLFAKVTTVLLTDKLDQYPFIESFVGQYSTPEDSNHLLVELMAQVNMNQGEPITRIGSSRFHQKVSALVAMCREWLACNRPVHSDRAEDYAKKFITRLERSVGFFAEGSKKASSSGAAAGMALLAFSLTRLLRVIDREVDRLPYDMIKGWYYHPRQKMYMASGANTDASSEAVRWLVGNAGIPLETRQAYEAALQAERVHMAEVIRQRLNLEGMNIASSPTRRAFESQKKAFLTRCINVETMLETAAHSGLLTESGPQAFMTQLEEAREEVESYESIRTLDDWIEIVNVIEKDLRNRTASLKERLQQRYVSGLETLRSQVADAVPDSWVENIDRALADDNLPVVQEMLEDLDRHIELGERMRAPDIKLLSILPMFTKVQASLHRRIVGKDIKQEVWPAVSEGGFKLGLTIAKPNFLKKPLLAMATLHNSKPVGRVNKQFFDQLADLLHAVGISTTEPAFSTKIDVNHDTGLGTSFTQLQLKAPDAHRPFPYFGHRRDSQYWTIIIAYQNWTVKTLREQVHNRGTPVKNCILLSMVPVSPEQREEFSRYCKDAQRSIFLLDPVSLVFMASVDNDQMGTSDIEKFLWLSAPYTYFNPYVGRTASPPEPEMRFGREHEINSLLNMSSGAAIVFGGRQLGKSTILEAVQRSFHKPEQKHFAYYSPLDRELRSEDPHTKESLDVAKREVWGRLHDFMVQDNLIAVPVNIRRSEALEKAVTDTIVEQKDCSIIALFDEIDPILKIDFAHDFPIFRSIRSLMRSTDVQGRFKMIIGGLANVKRFEDSPNYPLSQMGSSIQVTIMPSREATSLVMEPIQAAGYQFESTHVVNAILAATNRHPGLIQILCEQLLLSMGRNANGPVGKTVITRENVQAALNVPDVLDTIRERFEMTLNLDKRYLVMVYSILNEGSGAQSFSVAEAKDLATTWAPDTFGQYSDRQFKHFLNELVGLGVMRELDSGRFELRNTSVRKLLSETKTLDVQNKLEQAIQDMQEIDPMDYRAFSSAFPRPITYRDEKAITGMVVKEDIQKQGTIRPSHFTSTVVVGSEAQGLEQIKGSLPGLFEFEQSFFPEATRHKEYRSYQVSSTKYQAPVDFEKSVRSLFKQAEIQPQMLFISVVEGIDIALLLALLDTANSVGLSAKPARNPVRVVFLIGPQVYWSWLQASEVTSGREEAQSIIHLTRWKRCAINVLLEKLGMVDSAYEVDEVEKSTGGWHLAISNIVSLRKDRKTATTIRDFGRDRFQPLTKTDERNSRRFLKATGAYDLPWVLPLLRELVQEPGAFDRESFVITMLCVKELSDVPENEAYHFLEWLLAMDLLKAESTSGPQRKLVYHVAPEIRHMVETVNVEDASMD
ncbi:MAG: hypothetical protein P8X74_05415 [Reinekea sp.]